MAWVAAVRGQSSDKYLRVPAWACGAGLPHVVPTLPLDFSTLPLGDPTLFFGIRLRDAFSDPLALWNGERGYVRSALCRFGVAIVTPTGAKDPLLILSCLRAAASDDASAIARIQFRSPPAVQVDLPPLPAEAFWAVQPLSGTLANTNPAVAAATPVPFKPFRVAAASAAEAPAMRDEMRRLVREGLAGAMPREALTTSAFAARVLQAKPPRETSTAALAAEFAKAGAEFVFLQGQSVVRAMFAQAPSPQQCLRLCETLSVESAFLEDHRFRYRKKPDTILIRRTDGNPIGEAAAKALEQALGLKKVRVDGGAVLGVSNRARELHEKTAGPFSIRWLGAKSAEEARKTGPTEEDEEQQGAEGEEQHDAAAPAQQAAAGATARWADEGMEEEGVGTARAHEGGTEGPPSALDA